VIITTFKHKGLKTLYAEDKALGLPSHSAAKIKRILAALEFADDIQQVATFPGWRLHSLKGGRKGEYSITVTGNWRITFRLEGNSIMNLNYEDYH
jgi:proteic killer suppression protein